MGDEIKTKHPNCDGCAAEMKTRTSRLTGAEIHYDKWGRPYMACTAYKYEEEK